MDINFENSMLKSYAKLEAKLAPEIISMNKALTNNYDDERSSINLCMDKTIISDCNAILKKVNNAKVLVVVGIGGSNLGTMAIYDALQHKVKRKLYFADTCDPYLIKKIQNELSIHKKNNEKIVLNVISKSGGTTETIANYECLKKYCDYIVATTENGSKLYNHANDNNYLILDMPKSVGGRYSVFSNVGMFPLLFAGIDILELQKGAKYMRSQIPCLDNPAMLSAITIFAKNKPILNTFLFCPQLESLGKWYRQLLGESIGKEFDRTGKKVNTGITPTTSIGSTDLHSMAQLFLGGPSDKFHVIVDVKNSPKLKVKSKLLDLDTDLEKIMDAIIKGTKTAFKKRKIPFCEFTIELNEYDLAAFMQLKMVEMMYLGALFNVNPFDQPNVEEYKKVTKVILESS